MHRDDFTPVNGGSFTFKPVDSHYTYTFTVKMGDTVTEGLTFGANDTYTIEKISGNVEVTCTGKTPKQYDVKYKIDEDVEQDVTKGPETVTYLNDYSFVVTPRAGYSYRVIYSVDNGDPFVHTVIAVPTANDDGTLTYTIPGKEIVGGVEIWIDANTESGIPVVFTGNGVEDAASGNASSMGKNMPYYFTLNQRESCDYTVTAYYQPLASSTASKRPATVRSLGNGKYVVEAVNYNDYLYVYAHSWNLVVKVEKVSHSAEEVTVSKYLELNDKTNIFPLQNGIDFCGFHTYLTRTGQVVSKLRYSSIKRMKRRIRLWEKQYAAGEVSREKIMESFTAWEAHAKHGDKKQLRREMRSRLLMALDRADEARRAAGIPAARPGPDERRTKRYGTVTFQSGKRQPGEAGGKQQAHQVHQAGQ